MIRKAGFWVAAAALLAGCTAARAQDREGLRLVDLTARFDQVATATAALDDAARVAAFEQAMSGVAGNFYARARRPGRYTERVLANLKAYPEKRTAILAVGRDFQRLMGPARISFERVLGPVRSAQPVYLVHSLGEMDGGTRDIDGKDTLIFGADVISRIHAGTDMTPFFHHELFHVQHEAGFGGCKPLWCSLWEEGLATYVAGTLNPAAGDAALLLNIPAPIRPAVDVDRTAAVCAVVPLLDSTAPDDYASLFHGNAKLDGFPARMGYYIGYLVAAELGRTRSLRALAALRPAEARPLIDQALARLATCPKEQA
jgi:hypothetical protein